MKTYSLLLTVLLICCCCELTVAQKKEFSKTYKTGSKLYVHAVGGLSLRAKPDVKSAVVTLVKFGEQVIVQADAQPKVKFATGGISGAWVKVLYGQKTGYQFDGYLSRFETLNEGEGIQDYLMKRYGIESEENEPPDNPQNYNMYQKIRYKQGVEFLWSAPIGSNTITVTFPAALITFQELYLLAREDYPELNQCPYAPESMACPNEAEESSISLDLSEDEKSYTITWGHAD